MDREEQEYTGMSEEEFDAMYPDAGQVAHDDNFVNQNREDDVSTGSSPADFEDPNGHADESMYQGEPQEPEPEPAPQDTGVDERGVSWKNRAKELERKLAALEAKQQQPPAPEPPPQQQVELPPPLPPPQQPTQQPPGQQFYNQQTFPDIKKPEKLETVQDYEQLSQYNAVIIAKQMMEQQQTAQRVNQSIQYAMTEYPEIMDQKNPLHQWASYFLQTEYSNDQRFVREAAIMAGNKLGISPLSRRVVPQPQPQSKPLPRVTPQAPTAERGTPAAKQQMSKVRLSEESVKAARAFGQNPKDLEAMVRRQNYTFYNGQKVFE